MPTDSKETFAVTPDTSDLLPLDKPVGTHHGGLIRITDAEDIDIGDAFDQGFDDEVDSPACDPIVGNFVSINRDVENWEDDILRFSPFPKTDMGAMHDASRGSIKKGGVFPHKLEKCQTFAEDQSILYKESCAEYASAWLSEKGEDTYDQFIIGYTEHPFGGVSNVGYGYVASESLWGSYSSDDYASSYIKHIGSKRSDSKYNIPKLSADQIWLTDTLTLWNGEKEIINASEDKLTITTYETDDGSINSINIEGITNKGVGNHAAKNRQDPKTINLLDSVDLEDLIYKALKLKKGSSFRFDASNAVQLGNRG
jgi:hypothetical protein